MPPEGLKRYAQEIGPILNSLPLKSVITITILEE